MSYLLLSLVPVVLYVISLRFWSDETQKLLSYACIPFLVILAFYSLLLAILLIIIGFIGIMLASSKLWAHSKSEEEPEAIIIIRHHDRFF